MCEKDYFYSDSSKTVALLRHREICVVIRHLLEVYFYSLIDLFTHSLTHSLPGFIFGSVFQTEEEFEVTKKRILNHMRLTDVKFHSIKQTAMLGSNLTNAPNPSDVDECVPFNNDAVLNKPVSQAVNEDGNETEKVIPL